MRAPAAAEAAEPEAAAAAEGEATTATATEDAAAAEEPEEDERAIVFKLYELLRAADMEVGPAQQQLRAWVLTPTSIPQRVQEWQTARSRAACT
jgi:hypothetical protein